MLWVQIPVVVFNGHLEICVVLCCSLYARAYIEKNTVMVGPDKPVIPGQWLFRACISREYMYMYMYIQCTCIHVWMHTCICFHSNRNKRV